MSRRRGSARGTQAFDRRRQLHEWASQLAADAALQTQAIDVEQLASMVVANWGRGNVYERPPSERLPELELVANLEGVGEGGALLMLRGLACVAGAPVGPAAAQAADRLVDAGVSGPPWADGIGAATPTGAWVVRDADFDDGMMLFAEFDLPDGPTHTLALFANHNYGGKATIIGLTRSMAETLPVGSELGAAEPVSLAEMGARMRACLAAMPPHDRLSREREDAERYALACARAEALPDGFSLPAVAEVTPDDRFALLADFLESDEGSSYREDIEAQTAVALAIDYCAERDGKPLRWSPVSVGRFMSWWLPAEAAEQREVLATMPEALAAWISYCGRLRGVPRERVLDTVEAIDAWSEAMFAEADAYAREAAPAG